MLIIAPILVVAVGLAATPGRFSLDPYSPLMETLGMLTVQLLFVAMIVAVLSAEPLPRGLRLIETRALRVCGRWSFAMYLFHTPLIAVIYVVGMRIGWPLVLGSALPVQLLFTATCIGITVTLAALSWRFYERPISGMKRFFPVSPQRKPARESAPVEDVSAAA
jgi:peptidoglycan/LPS O-acetylase OafA/YrhL